MCKNLTEGVLYLVDLKDNRISPILLELVEALADSDNPHLVKNVARRLRLLSSSLDEMAHKIAKDHNRINCEICKRGSLV